MGVSGIVFRTMSIGRTRYFRLKQIESKPQNISYRKLSMKTIKIVPALCIMVLAFSLNSCAPKPELKALILTGQNNHSWKGSSTALHNILNNTNIFDVFVATSPRSGSDMSSFIIDFTPFDVVVLDYNGDEWPEETKNNFLNYQI